MGRKGQYDNPIQWYGQSYKKLKRTALASGQPFIDPFFPPNNYSIFKEGAGKITDIIWKRPLDICVQPRLFNTAGQSRHDLIQGQMGNCWVVAACSCAAIHEGVLGQIIPDYTKQELNFAKAGIFRFRFWRLGQWLEVVIDDLLPTHHGHLVFCHSRNDDEFWAALLEKAYAKFYGSYDTLDNGELAEALEDFSGGVSENISLQDGYQRYREQRDDLFTNIMESFYNGALIAAAINAQDASEVGRETTYGLILGHAYGVTDVRQMSLDGTGLFGLFWTQKLDMIRLRNPWGVTEWNGAFSDRSQEWKTISEVDRKKLQLFVADDGEFWMAFEDFVRNFQSVVVCRVVNTKLFSIRSTWKESILHGKWRTPDRCGGSQNHISTFLQNPQYLFDINPEKDQCIFCLSQKSSRGRLAGYALSVGFTILKVEVNRDLRVHRVDHCRIVFTSTYKNSRSSTTRLHLERGRYVIVLSTFLPGHLGEFLFRMYTGQQHKGSELRRDIPKRGVCRCLPGVKYPYLATYVNIDRIQDLGMANSSDSTINSFLVIMCEGITVRSDVQKDVLSPTWNFACVFYRKDKTSQVKIQVWHDGFIKRRLIGEVEIAQPAPDRDQLFVLNLLDAHHDQKETGVMYVRCGTADDFFEI